MNKRAIAVIVFGAAGVAVLVALGVWQLQRLEWKSGIIANLEERFAAAPVAIPEAPAPGSDGFLRVAVEGAVGEGEVHVLTSLKPEGPGYRVIVPIEMDDGRQVMADLGYVPERLKASAARPLPARIELVGALYWPEETDGFTPDPDIDRNIWFARDLAPMARSLGTEPILVIAESHDAGDWPRPRRLGVNLPNDHLQYALTWFSLAAIWAVMSAALLRRERRR